MKKQLQSLTIFLFFLFVVQMVHAQWQDSLWVGKQANNWIFHYDVGLDFNTTPPILLTSCKTSYYTYPGSEEGGTISDENGNLLFSVSLDTIWNKNHQVMLNGTAIQGTGGYFSGVQSGLTIPVPNTNNLYYVFNIKGIGGGAGNRLTYTIVDMDLNGGLGEVISKNILLTSPVAKKLTAVHHADGERVWIIAHEGNEAGQSNNFLAFLVSENGIAPPVISATGPVLGFSDGGQMKASPDGSKIAYVDGLTYFGVPPNLQVFHFDNETGQLSNPLDLTNAIASFPMMFGLEFSPNGRFLYMTNYDAFAASGSGLHQFDLQAGNQAAVLASHTVLAEVNVGDYEQYVGLQLASNGKIYVGSMSWYRPQNNINEPGAISVIHYPNNAGVAAGYEHAVVDLQRKEVGGSFPGFIQSYFESGILHEGDCAGNQVAFSTLRIPGIESAVWDFGDPNSGTGNSLTTTDGNSIHVFSGPGTYTVTATITSNGAQQTAVTEITIIEGARAVQPSNIVLCGTGSLDFELTSQNSIILDGQDPATHSVSYHASQADAENNSNPITNPGDYPSQGETIYARVTNDAGCYAITQFELVVSPEADLPEGLELTGCSPFDLTSISNQVDTALTLGWYENQTDAENMANVIVDSIAYIMTENEATVYLRGETGEGCYDIVEMKLIRHCDIPIPQGISPNGDAFNQNFDLSSMNIKNLQIFNRHGRSVYNKANYTDEWFGQTDEGDELPTGTYFYVIKLDKRETFKNKEVLAGWVYVNRQVN